MTRPVIFGDPSSIFVRGILIALAEKGVSYGIAAEAEQPLVGSGERLPGEAVMEHGGFVVRGTGPILRYIDDALPGPRLQPEAPRQRARMNRALEIHFGEAAPALGGRIVGRHFAEVLTGEWIAPASNENLPAAAQRTIDRLSEVLDQGPFFAGDMFTLADAALAPLFSYLMPLPEAALLLAPSSPLRSWWRLVSERESIRSTRSKTGFFSMLLPTE
jgi:glutathione S-transferase